MTPLRKAFPTAALATIACAPGGRQLTPVAGASCVPERVAAADGEYRFSFRGVSHDGRRIAIGYDSGAAKKGTYLIDLASSQRTDIPALNNGGSFSPDGRRLVAAVYVNPRNTEILEYELSTGRVDTIAADPGADFLPSYSPDGRRIVFNSYRTGRSDIYMYDRSTRSLRRLTTFEGYDAHAQFSPNGRQIVFHRQTAGSNYDLVQIDADGGNEVMLTTAPAEESYPAYSPDGAYVAYSDDRDHPGQPDLYILRLADLTATRLYGGAESETYPSWADDGRFIYFVSRVSRSSSVWRIPMRGAACNTRMSP